jgi:hypothetical protein
VHYFLFCLFFGLLGWFCLVFGFCLVVVVDVVLLVCVLVCGVGGCVTLAWCCVFSWSVMEICGLEVSGVLVFFVRNRSWKRMIKCSWFLRCV